MKKCRFCAEEIQDDARKCKHCGSKLSPCLLGPVALVILLVIGISVALFLKMEKDKRTSAVVSGPFHYTGAVELFAESKTGASAEMRDLRFRQAVQEARASFVSEYGDLSEAMKEDLRRIIDAEKDALTDNRKESYLAKAEQQYKLGYSVGNRQERFYYLQDAVNQYKLAMGLEADAQERLKIETKIKKIEVYLAQENNRLHKSAFPE